MNESYYQNKSINYGIAKTRKRKILELVGEIKNSRILDIGCATGYLGTEIKNKGNHVAGIEISKQVAKEAEKVLDKVYTFDLQKDWPSEIQKDKYDLAILAEVLEHVFDPVQVLRNIYNTLGENGEIVITTPNILAWPNRIKFLLGQFKYTDQGTFDFGHIRFFTYDYLKKVLSESSFDLIKENHIIFPGKLTKVLKHWLGLFANQFIIKAKKSIS